MKKFLMLLAVASLLSVSYGCKKEETPEGALNNLTQQAEKKAEEAKAAADKAVKDAEK
ncbi:MAG: hypothetical protein RBU25_01280 [Lentisphaeria bacterium]|jgi:hypothetical protein|nr:hypothetical protein [Lentisphaeria bacterium]